MSKKKLAVSLVTACAVVFAFSSQFVSAEEGPASIGDGPVVVTPFYDYTLFTNTALTISSGVATCDSQLTGIPGTTTRVRIYSYLQQYQNNSWVTIANWTGTYDTYKGMLLKTYSVSKGYLYRLNTNFYAYSGDDYEYITTYSNTVSY